MPIIEKYKCLVVRLDGKNVGIPLFFNHVLASIEDVEDAQALSREDLIDHEAKSLALSSPTSPTETSGIITVSDFNGTVSSLHSQKDIGRIVIFANDAIGVITDIVRQEINNTDTFMYATVRLLQI